MKAVFLNGPPGSGKDSVADIIWSRVELAEKFDFKNRLVGLAMAISNLAYDVFSSRSLKDIPHPTLNGLTPREFLIKLSEEWIKPIFGKDYFGRCTLESLQSTYCDLAIFSDSGFPEEAKPIIDHLGPENCLYIKVYRDDLNWGSDSRSFWMAEALNWGLAAGIFHNKGFTFQQLSEDIKDFFSRPPMKDFIP